MQEGMEPVAKKYIHFCGIVAALIFAHEGEKRTLELFIFLHGLAEKIIYKFTNLQILNQGTFVPKNSLFIPKSCIFRQKYAKNALFLTKNLRNWQKSANFAAANEICTSLCQWA